jgi:hypothetical protein
VPGSNCGCFSAKKSHHTAAGESLPFEVMCAMPTPAGRSLPLSLSRRFVCDLIHFAHQVPSVPVQRRMRLPELVAARQTAAPRPSWCAVFTKAYACVAAARPELRRSYLAFPRARLYEHAGNVASIAVERRVKDEDAVLFGHVRDPEVRTLLDLDRHLRALKERPVSEVGSFRRALSVSKLPRPLRRLGWWVGLNAWGRKRAHYFGTFGVSVYAGLGASSLHPLSPLTTTLNYGVFEVDGSIDVRIIYDHRVLDGAAVARALEHLERVLLSDILAELNATAAGKAA